MMDLPRFDRLSYSLALTALLAAGCGHSSPSPGMPDALGGSAGADAGMSSTGGTGGGATGGAGPTGGVTGGGGTGGMMAGTGGSPPDALPPGPITTTPPMPVISAGVPAYASSNLFNDTKTPSKANDLDTGTTWVSNTLPAWLAYDLSGVPAENRKNVLVAWYGPRTQDHLNEPTPPQFTQLPVDYTIEINAAAGGGAPPAGGWTVVATVTNNIKNSVVHLVNLNGGNWVRMNITKGPNPMVSIDMDVHAANSGPSDAWLMMGDSITAITFSRAFTNLQKLVHDRKPTYYPAFIGAGVGGTSTGSAVNAIDKYLKGYEGRFICLNYGTNDHPKELQMEALVQKVLAAGKIPVIPHMPWADGKVEEGTMINAMIDALYVKYPTIVRGPDLWALTLNRLDLIPPGDVHPTSKGQEEIRKAWADMMVKIYQ